MLLGLVLIKRTSTDFQIYRLTKSEFSSSHKVRVRPDVLGLSRDIFSSLVCSYNRAVTSKENRNSKSTAGIANS